MTRTTRPEPKQWRRTQPVFGGAGPCGGGFAENPLSGAEMPASGQTSPYPELDAASGVTNAMAAAAANCNTILTSMSPAFLNFTDEPMEAMAAA